MKKEVLHSNFKWLLDLLGLIPKKKSGVNRKHCIVFYTNGCVGTGKSAFTTISIGI